MGLIPDYDVRIVDCVDCGFIIKFLSSTLSKGTQSFDFFKLVASIVNNMERINTRKRNTINIVQCSKC